MVSIQAPCSEIQQEEKTSLQHAKAKPHDSKLGTTSWHSSPLSAVQNELKANLEDGLSFAEAAERQKSLGYNELPASKVEPVLIQFCKQLISDPFSIILGVAALLSTLLGFLQQSSENFHQALFLLSIVIFMNLLGFLSERRADSLLSSYRSYQNVTSQVKREAQICQIPSRELVVGDVAVFQEGDYISIDGLVLSASEASIDQQLLTGESLACPKAPGLLDEAVELAERSNMVYAGTYVDSGYLTVLVVATGQKTEYGQIADRLEMIEKPPTLMQTQLEVLAKLLLWGAMLVCILILSVYAWRGMNLLDAVIVAIALAIAFVPEAMGFIVEISLAISSKRMAARKIIVRRRQHSVASGTVRVIATDKTGTITRGEMAVSCLSIGKRIYKASDWTEFKLKPDAQSFLLAVQSCQKNQGETERSLAEFSAVLGEISSSEELAYLPFRSEKRLSAVICRIAGVYYLFVKGDPDVILPSCKQFYHGESSPMTVQNKRFIAAQLNKMELEGNRVLAYSMRILSSEDLALGIDDPKALLGLEMTWLGMVGLRDTLRPEVPATIQKLREMGVEPKMITGDRRLSAIAIAQEAGLIDPALPIEKQVLIGSALDNAAKNKLDLSRIVVFAQMLPQQKSRVLELLQANGERVMMVGDAVNDLPALKTADVSVAVNNAMDIVINNADIVLKTNYDGIPGIIEEGRIATEQARRYIHALLSSNMSQILIFIVFVLMALEMPLTAIQLLLINLLGDAWLSMALAAETIEPAVLKRGVRKNAKIISPYMWLSMAIQAFAATFVMLIAFWTAQSWAQQAALSPQASLVLGQTAVFLAFMAQKIFRSAGTARSFDRNIWEYGLFSNRWSILAAALSILLMVIALFVPQLGMVLAPIPLIGLWLALGLFPALVEEFLKFLRKTGRLPQRYLE